jgi:hypothetical protein
MERHLMIKHNPMKTASWHHVSSLLQKVFGVLPTGWFLITFHSEFNHSAGWKSQGHHLRGAP